MRTSTQHTITRQYPIDHYDERTQYDLHCLLCSRFGNRSTLWNVEEGKLCDECLTKYMNGFTKIRKSEQFKLLRKHGFRA